MGQVEANRSELRDLMEAWAARTDGRFDALIARTDARFAEQQHWMDLRFADVQLRLVDQDQKSEVRFSRLETRIERRFGDLMKWSFLFWCGGIGAMVTLVRLLR